MSLSDWEIRRDKTGATALFTKEGGNCGISIHVNKGKRTFHISGWYDSMVGLPGADISLEELEGLLKPAAKPNPRHGPYCTHFKLIDRTKVFCAEMRGHDGPHQYARA